MINNGNSMINDQLIDECFMNTTTKRNMKYVTIIFVRLMPSL